MPRPSHGAVGLAFLGTRALQVVSLVISLSFAAKFVSTMIDNQQTPPSPLIGVLSVVCFAVLYCATTLLLYWDRQLPLLATAAIDGTVSKRQYALPQQQAQQEPAYESWLRTGSEGDCVMMKAVWGFGIALTILFVFSAVMVAFIWKAEKQKGMAGSKAAVAEGA